MLHAFGGPSIAMPGRFAWFTYKKRPDKNIEISTILPGLSSFIRKIWAFASHQQKTREKDYLAVISSVESMSKSAMA